MQFQYPDRFGSNLDKQYKYYFCDILFSEDLIIEAGIDSEEKVSQWEMCIETFFSDFLFPNPCKNP